MWCRSCSEEVADVAILLLLGLLVLAATGHLILR